jgi:hypothetical protein
LEEAYLLFETKYLSGGHISQKEGEDKWIEFNTEYRHEYINKHAKKDSESEYDMDDTPLMWHTIAKELREIPNLREDDEIVRGMNS